ncbi:MAG: LLM class F420-dependent oxidoreductase [Actinomycetota bacterium]
MDISIAGMFGNSPRRDVGFIRAFAVAAEELGFRALYAPEHVVFFASYESSYPYTIDGSPAWGPDTGIYDPLFVFQAAAGVTTELRFCTGVLILPQRPVLLTAKEVLTLDHLTGGRFELGVGSGWSWEEYEALGVPFAERGKRMDEYLDVLRLVWAEDRATYDGRFISFDGLVLNPKPVSAGGPPIIVGGDSAAAMRRAARTGDGWYGWWAQHDDHPPLPQHLERLRTILADHDRSTADPDFSLRLGLPVGTGTPDEVGARLDEARALGVDELVLAPLVPTSGFEESLAAWAEAGGLGS